MTAILERPTVDIQYERLLRHIENTWNRRHIAQVQSQVMPESIVEYRLPLIEQSECSVRRRLLRLLGPYLILSCEIDWWGWVRLGKFIDRSIRDQMMPRPIPQDDLIRFANSVLQTHPANFLIAVRASAVVLPALSGFQPDCPILLEP